MFIIEDYSAPLQLQLHGIVERDGTATVHGVLQLREGRERSVLVATGTGGTAACADADGDGLGGIVALTASLREARTGAIVEMRITPTGDHDLDEAGRYRVALAFDRSSVEAEVRFSARWVGAAPDQR